MRMPTLNAENRIKKRPGDFSHPPLLFDTLFYYYFHLVSVRFRSLPSYRSLLTICDELAPQVRRRSLDSSLSTSRCSKSLPSSTTWQESFRELETPPTYPLDCLIRTSRLFALEEQSHCYNKLHCDIYICLIRHYYGILRHRETKRSEVGPDWKHEKHLDNSVNWQGLQSATQCQGFKTRPSSLRFGTLLV